MYRDSPRMIFWSRPSEGQGPAVLEPSALLQLITLPLLRDNERIRPTPDDRLKMPSKHLRSDSSSEVETSRKRHACSTPESRLEHDVSHVDDTKLGKFNRKFLRIFQEECTKALERDAESDLAPFFETYHSRYSNLREARKGSKS